MPDKAPIGPDPLDLLPHSGPARLPERILDLQPGSRVRAVKTVRPGEPYLNEAGALPAVLLVELMAQTGGLLIDGAGGAPGRYAVLAGIKRMHVHGTARAGETVSVDCRLVRRIGDLYLVECRGEAAGRDLAHGTIQIRVVRGTSR